MLQVYTLFHLNTSYSSIEESTLPDLIHKCYWPILHAVRQHGFKYAIEASAYTLEKIAETDQVFVKALSALVGENKIEFVASGYTQAIGPLMPEKCNWANIFHANQIYHALLGIVPEIVLVNEQAFSTGLIQLYREAGYKGMIMEWNNAAAAHPDWQAEWRYHPQLAVDDYGGSMPVIWGDSINFQQFQRYVHGDIDMDAYEKFINSQRSHSKRVMSLYANDAEVFDFRPGRYHAETELIESEWQKITTLFLRLRDKHDVQFIFPSEVLADVDEGSAFNRLNLSSAELPVPVKKQGKYNLLRWAVSGRNDLDINTRCWRLFSKMKDIPIEEPIWRKLCQLWASDFRTHITQLRWDKYLQALEALESEFLFSSLPPNKPSFSRSTVISRLKVRPHRIERLNRAGTSLELDTKRGLSIRACYFNGEENAWFGVIPHGYFHHIRYAADWYSGHMIYEAGGHHKITDLCSGVISRNKTEISADIKVDNFGRVHKSIFIDEDGGVVLKHHFTAETQFDGVWRCGFITLNPEAFDKNTLFYATHNGGGLETFPIRNEFDHGSAVSHLVSANCGLGATQGILVIGDEEKQLAVTFDHTELAIIPMLSFAFVDDQYLLRLCFSLRELDDTRKYQQSEKLDYEFAIRIKPVT